MDKDISKDKDRALIPGYVTVYVSGFAAVEGGIRRGGGPGMFRNETIFEIWRGGGSGGVVVISR